MNLAIGFAIAIKYLLRKYKIKLNKVRSVWIRLIRIHQRMNNGTASSSVDLTV